MTSTGYRPIAALLGVLFVTWAVPAAAQDTREAVTAEAQAEKAANPPPVTQTKPEEVADRIAGFLTPKPRGAFPYFGSVYGGGGFTLGAGYGMAVGDQATFQVRGLYTIKNYKLIEVATFSPGHLEGRLLLTGTAGWRNATQAPFYGLGMQTQPDDRTNFDLKEWYAEGTAQLRVTDWSVVSGAVALEAYTIGPGKGEDASTDEVFTPETAPGLGTDPTYVHSRGTAGIDWRTSPGYSRTGGYYGVTLHNYTNTNGAFDFNRLDGEVVQHIPILRETWVLSVRGRVQTTLGGGNDTPYFLLPYLGGGSTLRGYKSRRFRDKNSLLTQAEFRWIPNRLGMDLAIFYDAGKVASRPQDLDFTGMAHDWGIGVRLHSPTVTPIRLELAHGSEGWHMVFGGSAAF